MTLADLKQLPPGTRLRYKGDGDIGTLQRVDVKGFVWCFWEREQRSLYCAVHETLELVDPPNAVGSLASDLLAIFS